MQPLVAPPPTAPPAASSLGWTGETTTLLRKWERSCTRRKQAHYRAGKTYGWKNKLLSIPVVIISTILGSLSFIHPSMEAASGGCPPQHGRVLQSEACDCSSYLNGATSTDGSLCRKTGTSQCYPPNAGDGLCPGDMFACVPATAVPTEAPSLDGYVPELDNGPGDCCTHTAAWDDQFTLMCQTCAYDVVVRGLTGTTYKWYASGAVQYQLTCASGWGAMAGKAFCSGQNNQNGGRPSYMATCLPSCDTPGPSAFPTPAACANNCCTSGPDMWSADASPSAPGWTVSSPYLDHTNGGLGEKDRCEDMCRADPLCNSWMWRSSGASCYLSTEAELVAYSPNPGYNDHHPHVFSRTCTPATAPPNLKRQMCSPTQTP